VVPPGAAVAPSDVPPETEEPPLGEASLVDVPPAAEPPVDEPLVEAAVERPVAGESGFLSSFAGFLLLAAEGVGAEAPLNDSFEQALTANKDDKAQRSN
jgi:hypothetical protein